jgi:hypothetical protein
MRKKSKHSRWREEEQGEMRSSLREVQIQGRLKVRNMEFQVLGLAPKVLRALFLLRQIALL